jgi:hypothetical protein
MSSIRRILASRANGARSRGPKTAAGKQRPSSNARRHGLLANCLVLENESVEGFHEILDDFIDRPPLAPRPNRVPSRTCNRSPCKPRQTRNLRHARKPSRDRRGAVPTPRPRFPFQTNSHQQTNLGSNPTKKCQTNLDVACFQQGSNAQKD